MKQFLENEADDILLNNFDIFGEDIASIQESIEEDVFEGGDYIKFLELNPQGSSDNTDSAIVRFVKNISPKGDDGKPAKNIISKTSYFVKSADGVKYMYDCPKTLNYKNPCDVADYFKSIKNDELKKEAFRKVFKYGRPDMVLVQVLKYDSHPELVGSIMPVRIQEEVRDIINKTVKPSAEDIELNGTKPLNVFDPLTAPAFMLKATMKSHGTGDDGKTKMGRFFGTSMFVKAESYKYFLIPQLDEKGEPITKKVGELDVIQYEKIQLTAEEVVDYEKRNFTDAMKSKLVSVIKHLQSSTKHVDIDYQEATEEMVANNKILVECLRKGEVATLGGTIVDEAKETETETETETDTNKVTNTEVDETDDILAQALNQ